MMTILFEDMSFEEKKMWFKKKYIMTFNDVNKHRLATEGWVRRENCCCVKSQDERWKMKD